jgi:putative ABC transport system ATP-binding protein
MPVRGVRDESGVSTLELQQVVKHYRGPSEVVRAVDGVTLTVGPGEIVVLLGPSGSGKSTLLMLASGLLTPDSGAVCFDERNLSNCSAGELVDYQRHKVGFIYQEAHLMGGVPAVENAAIKLLADRVPLRQARREAVPWLERVGLGRRIEHTPEQLSGGERQRVAVARALVNDPRLILADEPTGSLDSRRSREILALLAELCRERRTAILLATHDLQATEITDRLYTLTDGRLIEANDPLEAVSPQSRIARS